ncbi:MAG: hypothetical protein KBE16_03320 [Alphaproteobacteria bacterium]|nr:hypothetical protein [Alphaproteobacteria bacterium]MBP9877063.1 hypothetical protein [Alphaproteobacteria bacterium]
MITGPVDPNITSLLATTDAADLESMATQKGHVPGTDETVEVLSELNIGLDVDDLEELSVGISELRGREITKAFAGKADRQEVFRKMGRVFDLLPDLNEREKLLDIVDLIREYLIQNSRATDGDILQFIQAKTPYRDVSHLYVTLKFLQESFSLKAEDNQFKIIIERVLKSYAQENGAAIKAGLNITTLAFAESQKPGMASTQDLRDNYRDVVLKFDGFPKTFLNLLKKYGIDHFAQGVHFLYLAAGADMSSAKSSIEPDDLQEIREGLYQMASLQTMIQKSKSLVNRFHKSRAA